MGLLPSGANALCSINNRVQVYFADCDFTVRVAERFGNPGNSLVRLDITAVVRAREPSVDTWWSQWRFDCPEQGLPGLLAHEIAQQRTRFQRMVTEDVRRRY
jgi:hypothetical protein